MIRLLIFSLVIIFSPLRVNFAEDQQEIFHPENGDSVVLLGGTLIERAQQYGFWESMMISQLADRQVVFRNLGWSGDTVFADSRGIFDPPAKGYQRMIERIKKISPRYILISYGGNESFKGPDGVASFLNQLEVLLKDLKSEKTEVILISPIKFEKMPSPLPDPIKANKNRKIYVDGLKKFAEVHNLKLLDLFSTLVTDDKSTPEFPKTYNGIHLTPDGYHQAAGILRKQIFPNSQKAKLKLNSDGTVVSQSGLAVSQLKKNANGFSFQLERKTLPLINAKDELAEESLVNLSFKKLSAGNYTLSVDGKTVVKASADEWKEGLAVQNEADLKQARELNAIVLNKNELYFHSWRPENITYLFGFRKHEQGQNAKEIDVMMTLVKKEEEKINSLRENRTSTWTFTRD